MTDRQNSLFEESGAISKSLHWIDPPANCTQAYNIFAITQNELDFHINLFENLMISEDLRNEQNGKLDFPIDIPEEYFRFPDKTNNLYIGIGSVIDDNEKIDIQKAKKLVKKRLRSSKDETFIREVCYKSSFLLYCGYFENFLGRIIDEKNLLDTKIPKGKSKESFLESFIKKIICFHY